MGAAADLGVSDRLAKLENGRGEAGGAWVGGAERRGSRTGILARSCYLPNENKLQIGLRERLSNGQSPAIMTSGAGAAS